MSAGGRKLEIDAGGINRDIVLENDAVVGSVNANLRHYEQAAEALAHADSGWLQRLVTAKVPLARAAQAFERSSSDDVKVVITFDEEAVA